MSSTKAIMKRILKVIKQFKGIKKTYLVKETDLVIVEGKPTTDIELIPIELAVMTEKKGFYIQPTTYNQKSSYSNEKYECYYDYSNEEVQEILENQRIVIEGQIYRVDIVEKNYDLFIRFIVFRENKKDEKLENLIAQLRG